MCGSVRAQQVGLTQLQQTHRTPIQGEAAHATGECRGGAMGPVGRRWEASAWQVNDGDNHRRRGRTLKDNNRALKRPVAMKPLLGLQDSIGKVALPIDGRALGGCL